MDEVNVRVAVRVRPLLQKEKLSGEQMCIRIIPSTNQVVVGRDKAFTFDHLLSSKSIQEEVYEKCVEPLVKSCFEGYNATVFAYGQTGSGKTYTMGGGNMSSMTEDEIGIIPRALSQMFQIMQSNHNREYTVRVSYVEIYKEELQDLLDLDTSSKDLHIREDDKGNTLIQGVSEFHCESLDEVMSCLEQGSAYRHTATTQMNDHSSRSHSVFTVLIEQKWSDVDEGRGRRERLQSCDSEVMEETGEVKHFMCAKFHFVDLAGSERAHRTGNVGDRFKESVHINSGLLALGNVISALGDTKKKQSHIPYRDSKITRLLKDSLGGNSQTVMICCISPSTANFDESLNALKYANRARNIKNKPIVNRDVQSLRFEEMQTEIKALREELQKQRTTLFTAGTNVSDFDMTKAMQDAEKVSQLEQKIIRLQTECAHYQMIAEEAHKQLRDIQGRDVLSQSQTVRLRDWLELMEEIKNKVPQTLSKEQWENQTIARLEVEINQYKKDLESDEEIFAEKNKEVGNMQQRIADLESANEELSAHLEESHERQKQQEQQLVEQGIQLEEMASKLKESEDTLQSSQTIEEALTGRTEAAPPSTRRAKSVPAHMLTDHQDQQLHPVTPRNIHTSPAQISLDRVMQNFRARSQLIAARMEENDDVIRQSFSDDSQDEQIDNAFGRNTVRRGTYRIKKPQQRKTIDMRASQTDDEKLATKTRVISKQDLPLKPIIKVTQHQKKPGSAGRNSSLDASRLRCSTEIQKKRLKQTQIQVQQSSQKMRDLSINIKMKEQLIRELVKTGKDAEHMNKQYEHKIVQLEQEKAVTKSELQSLQKAMVDLEAKEQHETSEKNKLQSEFQKKLEQARGRMQTLQRKQKETQKMATITANNDKKIIDLESAVDKMKQQQDSLQKRLKEEVDRKTKLERDMQKEQQRVKELELRNEQQQKVLKIKTEEIVAVQKKLRTGVMGSAASRFSRNISKSASVGDDPTRLNEQRKWLDGEIEKVLEQRQQMETLQQELQKREEIIEKKEGMLAERSELEMKKLRSSQVLNRDIITVSSKLESVERRLDEKKKELRANSTSENDINSVKEAIRLLQQNRDKLRKQRLVLDEKLHDGSMLNPQQERRLIELDEAMEALDAAIDYKNEVISNQEEEIRKSQLLTQDEDSLLHKLHSLSGNETRSLLSKYFEKVIGLREAERQKELLCSELEMKLDEQERIVAELETSLQRKTMETDRKLTVQQQDYEKKMQLLVHQLTQNEGDSTSTATSHESEAKIQQLERDLYYYKKTSRELKKKLREVMASITGSQPGPEGDKDSIFDSPRDKLSTPRTPTNGHVGRDVSDSRQTSRQITDTVQNLGSQSARTESTHSQRLAADMPLSARTDKQHHMAANLTSKVKGGKVKGEGQKTPVKISRNNLRPMTDEEVFTRKSNTSQCPGSPQDSLELGNNPWK